MQAEAWKISRDPRNWNHGSQEASATPSCVHHRSYAQLLFEHSNPPPSLSLDIRGSGNDSGAALKHIYKLKHI